MTWRHKALGFSSSARLTLRRRLGDAAAKKRSTTMSMFLEMKTLEVEHSSNNVVGEANGIKT